MEHPECLSNEASIGLEVFFTKTRGIGGKLKQSPEDFLVQEISAYPERSEGGKFTIAKITAENWEMNRLVRQFSKMLGISRVKIGFAGTKDKRAVTSQLMSFEAPLEQVTSLSIHQVRIDDAYPAKKGINIGELVGNAFEIGVSYCSLVDAELEAAIEETKNSLDAIGGFPNFFGVQRFGAVRPVTHVVGKAIVNGDFEKAVLLYCGNPVKEEAEDSQEARRRLDEERDFEAAIGYFPKKLTFERTMIGHLARNPEDHCGALQTLPLNLQMMFVHAYQSYLFNRMLSARIRRGLPLDRPLIGDMILPTDRLGLPDHDHSVPVTEKNIDLVEKQVRAGRGFVSGVLYGTESQFSTGEMGEIERRVIQDEGLERRDFNVPQLPQCSSKGNRRELLGKVRELNTGVAGDKATFKFSLNKGCYATSFLREYMKKELLLDY